MDGTSGVIGDRIGETDLYKPGPKDDGYNIGSVLIQAGQNGHGSKFLKEMSPNGEYLWRRIEAPEIQIKEN